MACHPGPHGKTPGGPEAEDRSQLKVWARTFLGVSLGKARQGKMNSLGLVGLTIFAGLWTIEVVTVAWED